jgi:hypothetical protein
MLEEEVTDIIIEYLDNDGIAFDLISNWIEQRETEN